MKWYDYPALCGLALLAGACASAVVSSAQELVLSNGEDPGPYILRWNDKPPGPDGVRPDPTEFWFSFAGLSEDAVLLVEGAHCLSAEQDFVCVGRAPSEPEEN